MVGHLHFTIVLGKVEAVGHDPDVYAAVHKCCTVGMLNVYWMDSLSWLQGKADDPGAESIRSSSSTPVCQFQHERNESQPGASVIASNERPYCIASAS